jgi:hypothetical protein
MTGALSQETFRGSTSGVEFAALMSVFVKPTGRRDGATA